MPEESEEEVKQAVGLYEQIARKDPEREVSTDGDEMQAKSLQEKTDESPELSDMKAVAASLFPEGLGDETLNKAMIGRIGPEVFIPLLRLATVEKIMRTDSEKPINVVETMTETYTLLSIGLEGKGRIDLLELAGSTKENEDLEKGIKGLFA